MTFKQITILSMLCCFAPKSIPIKTSPCQISLESILYITELTIHMARQAACLSSNIKREHAPQNTQDWWTPPVFHWVLLNCRMCIQANGGWLASWGIWMVWDCQIATWRGHPTFKMLPFLDVQTNMCGSAGKSQCIFVVEANKSYI